MKKILLLSILAIGFSISLTAQKNKVSLEDIWEKGTFSPNYVSGFNFLNDGKHYTKQEYNSIKSVHQIKKYDLTTGEEVATVFDGTALKDFDNELKGTFSGYSLSAKEDQILLATQSEKIYRHSSRANYYIYDVASKAVKPLSDGGKQRLATFNPQGTKVAFVRDNDIFVKDLENGTEKQITRDGSFNKIINGASDWVYEEEFGDDNAFQWSPDGEKIAFLRFDEAHVKMFSMTMYTGEMYPEAYDFKYPKVGEDNAIVTVHIHDLSSKKTLQVETGQEKDIYFPRIKWTQDPNQLCVFRLNRHQNHLELLLAEAKTGKISLLLEEKNKYYIDIHDDLTFLKNGKEFVWTSEKSGFNHIYLYDMESKEAKTLTSGEYDVTRFYGLDEERNMIFYQAAKTSPLERHVYSIDLKKGKERLLTKGQGQHSAQFSSTFDYFVNNHSAANMPYEFTVKDSKGKTIRTIENNSDLVKTLDKYEISYPEFMTIPTKDAILNAWMIKPADFDKSKQYPVLMYVYGGPGSQTVADRWMGSNFFWYQHLASKGYIVVSVDNRGTGARGQEFKKMTYLELGKYETIDQIEAAKYLGNQSYVDASRIGIFGWSYGGYMSSLCLFKGNDHFKAAIAVAPVTNWKWYDTIYTERYMRTRKENEKGYEQNSPINFVDLYKKGSYLLVHGVADDNVHFQHTAEMANALIRNKKQFDTYFYPNRNHGIYGGNARIHLYTKMTNFLLGNL